MDFSLSEEQKMLQTSASDFLQSRCEKSLLRELEVSDTGHSAEIWHEMAELGWMGIIIPEGYGGADCSLMEMAVLFEEIGRAAFSSPLACTTLGTMAILEGGTEDIKNKILPEVASGDLILTIAVEEAGVAYELNNIETSAKQTGEGYVINGTKLFVPYAKVADYIIVAARTAGAKGDAQGITLFMVNAKTPGINTTFLKTIAGDKQYQVEFKDVAVANSDVIGEVNKGFELLKSIYEKAIALQCAEMVGIAEQQQKITVEYVAQRVQFGRPLGTFQAVQHRLSDMFTDIQGARWTSYQAIYMLTMGEPAAIELAIAKAFTSDACQRVAAGAIQLHGGIGLDTEYDLHFYFTKAKALELKYGPAPIHLKALETELAL